MIHIHDCGIGFSVKARIEDASRRIWVTDYSADKPANLRRHLLDTSRKLGLGKIILPVKSEDVDRMKGDGFYVEGVIQGYFNGNDACFLSAFPSQRRAISLTLSRERKILHEIINTKSGLRKHLPKEFNIRRATAKDAAAISKLFKKVFATYPAPVYDPLYLARSMEKGDVFMVVFHHRRLVGVAAAEIQADRGNAELTNCATDPEYRGLGLNSILLACVEKKCISRKIGCLYSLARASSYGMNLVLHRLGYDFTGTLINNCHISGRFENMNIWVKSRKNEYFPVDNNYSAALPAE
ncbi:MAG: putative beta-lysine N-acetyltransferase [Bacillota bacterium]